MINVVTGWLSLTVRLLLKLQPVAIATLIATVLFASSVVAMENSDLLLDGAIDFHVHSAPDVTPRSVDDFELAEAGAAAGMRAIVLKNHVTPTADRAVLANKIVPNIELFGGVVLNYSVGGLNPHAVEVMYQIGRGKGKVVWLPTVDADYHRRVFGKPGRGIKVAEAGKLLPETREILELVAKYDLVLETGHISPEEVELVVKQAKDLEIDKILITHAIADAPGLSVAQMRAMADLGAFLELTYVNHLMGQNSAIAAHQNWHRVSIARMAEVIQTIGAEHFVLSTDLGRDGDPQPVAGYKQFITELTEQGISEAAIQIMSRTNPAKLLRGVTASYER